MPCWTNLPWPPNLNQPASGNPGAVHIYLIGLVPTVDLSGLVQEDRKVTFFFNVADKKAFFSFDLPDGFNLSKQEDRWLISNATGQYIHASKERLLIELHNTTDELTFEVLYIGQAYGKSGSRKALDRLLKHETLQKISLKGAPPGYRLELLLLGIQENNTVTTFINPRAKDDSTSAARITDGVDKLFDTDDAERITLYEAALIRYFQPQYNIEFKNSFPSTKQKVLSDCYGKDFAAVSAEISLDNLYYNLCSEQVAAAHYHLAYYDLHNEDDRKFFFFGKSGD